jgi:parallel beta-helix repeat protein
MSRGVRVGLVLLSLSLAGCSLGQRGNLPFEPVLRQASWVRPVLDIPSHAVRIPVGEDPRPLIDSHPPGTTFVFESGVHRIRPITPRNGDVFFGEPGATLSGAVVIEGFQSSGGRWFVPDVEAPGGERGRCVTGYEACRFPEELFLDGRRVHRVTGLAEVAEGSWFFDYGSRTLWMGDDPTGRLVEMAVVPQAFTGDARDVTIQGLVIEAFASTAQDGAIRTSRGWVVDGNEIRHNHAAGVRLAAEVVVSRNFVHHNGQFGIAGGGRSVLVEGNEIAYNGVAGFNPLWAAGGTKFVMTRDLVARGNLVYGNRGPGLWTDIDNVESLIEDNRVYDNAHAGIKHEISYAAVIRNNVVEGNGFGHGVRRRGAGILVRESADVQVTGNRLRGNADGIILLQEDRGDGPLGPYELRNVVVSFNHLDLGDGSVGLIESVGGRPLEAGNRFSGNAYVVADNSAAFLWGSRSYTYREWVERGLESGSRLIQSDGMG